MPDPDDDSAQLDLAFGSPPAPRDYAEDESDALFPLLRRLTVTGSRMGAELVRLRSQC